MFFCLRRDVLPFVHCGIHSLRFQRVSHRIKHSDETSQLVLSLRRRTPSHNKTQTHKSIQCLWLWWLLDCWQQKQNNALVSTLYSNQSDTEQKWLNDSYCLNSDMVCCKTILLGNGFRTQMQILLQLRNNKQLNRKNKKSKSKIFTRCSFHCGKFQKKNRNYDPVRRRITETGLVRNC